MRLPIARDGGKAAIFEPPRRGIIRSYALPLEDGGVEDFIDFYMMLVKMALQEIWWDENRETTMRGNML